MKSVVSAQHGMPPNLRSGPRQLKEKGGRELSSPTLKLKQSLSTLQTSTF